MESWGQGARYLAESLDAGRDGTPSTTVTRMGRLVEVRIGRLETPEQVISMSRQILAALERVGREAIICADHRLASPVSREVADVWARRMRGGNAKRTRSAMLIDPSNTTYNLQLARVIQCALSPTRRMFTDAAELVDWLGGAVTESERRELRAFLD